MRFSKRSKLHVAGSLDARRNGVKNALASGHRGNFELSAGDPGKEISITPFPSSSEECQVKSIRREDQTMLSRRSFLKSTLGISGDTILVLS